MRHLCRRSLPVVCGDVEDPHFHESLPLGRARWVVSTPPERGVNLTLLKALRDLGYRGSIAVAAHDDEDAKALAWAGATRVLAPFSALLAVILCAKLPIAVASTMAVLAYALVQLPWRAQVLLPWRRRRREG